MKAKERSQMGDGKIRRRRLLRGFTESFNGSSSSSVGVGVGVGVGKCLTAPAPTLQ